MNLEIGKHLVLSTMHVRCATAERLSGWALQPPENRPLAIALTTYGWFISTCEIEDPLRADIPAELLPILEFARRHDCTHVLFDCDAPRIGALPEFPW